MLVSQLEESMRKIIRQRIDAGVLSGTVLARQTGFQQAHISNFLNRRRDLTFTLPGIGLAEYEIQSGGNFGSVRRFETQ